MYHPLLSFHDLVLTTTTSSSSSSTMHAVDDPIMPTTIDPSQLMLVNPASSSSSSSTAASTLGIANSPPPTITPAADSTTTRSSSRVRKPTAAKYLYSSSSARSPTSLRLVVRSSALAAVHEERYDDDDNDEHQGESMYAAAAEEVEESSFEESESEAEGEASEQQQKRKTAAQIVVVVVAAAASAGGMQMDIDQSESMSRSTSNASSVATAATSTHDSDEERSRRRGKQTASSVIEEEESDDKSDEELEEELDEDDDEYREEEVRPIKRRRRATTPAIDRADRPVIRYAHSIHRAKRERPRGIRPIGGIPHYRGPPITKNTTRVATTMDARKEAAMEMEMDVDSFSIPFPASPAGAAAPTITVLPHPSSFITSAPLLPHQQAIYAAAAAAGPFHAIDPAAAAAAAKSITLSMPPAMPPSFPPPAPRSAMSVLGRPRTTKNVAQPMSHLSPKPRPLPLPRPAPSSPTAHLLLSSHHPRAAPSPSSVPEHLRSSPVSFALYIESLDPAQGGQHIFAQIDQEQVPANQKLALVEDYEDRFPALGQMTEQLQCSMFLLDVNVDMPLAEKEGGGKGSKEEVDDCCAKDERFGEVRSKYEILSDAAEPLLAITSIYSYGVKLAKLHAHMDAPIELKLGQHLTKYLHLAPFPTRFFSILLQGFSATKKACSERKGKDGAAAELSGTYTKAREEMDDFAESLQGITVIQHFVRPASSSSIVNDPSAATAAAGQVVLLVAHKFRTQNDDAATSGRVLVKRLSTVRKEQERAVVVPSSLRRRPRLDRPSPLRSTPLVASYSPILPFHSQLHKQTSSASSPSSSLIPTPSTSLLPPQHAHHTIYPVVQRQHPSHPSPAQQFRALPEPPTALVNSSISRFATPRPSSPHAYAAAEESKETIGSVAMQRFTSVANQAKESKTVGLGMGWDEEAVFVSDEHGLNSMRRTESSFDVRQSQ